MSWYIEDDERNAEEKIIEISKALNDIRLTVSDAPRKYIDNTLEIIGKYYTTDNPALPKE